MKEEWQVGAVYLSNDGYTYKIEYVTQDGNGIGINEYAAGSFARNLANNHGNYFKVYKAESDEVVNQPTCAYCIAPHDIKCFWDKKNTPDGIGSTPRHTVSCTSLKLIKQI